MNLDDAAAFATVDRRDALADVEGTAAQWRNARALPDVDLSTRGTQLVLVTGMGGSGVTGDVLAALAAERSGPPVLVSKGYDVPAFVSTRTLLIAISHSGNTEETLAAVDRGLDRGAQLLAVTSGGALLEHARQIGAPAIVVPGGGQPRHSLGWLLVPLLRALGLDDGLDEAIDLLAELAVRWGRSVPTEENAAKHLGQRLASGGVPVILGGPGIAAVAAYRAKCQLNENAKLPAHTVVLPEADHNEVVGWQETSALTGSSGMLEVRDGVGNEHPRVATRFRVTREILEPSLAWTEAIHAEGDSVLARMASLLLAVDLSSVYAALARDVDPSPIPHIDRLKAALASS